MKEPDQLPQSIMRGILILLLFVAPLACFATEAPRLELKGRQGEVAHLLIVNSSNREAFLWPFVIIEVFYEKPVGKGAAQGWIATRPRLLGENVVIGSGDSYKFDSLASYLPTRFTVYYAPTAAARKEDFKPLRIELPALKPKPGSSAAKNEKPAGASSEEKRGKPVAASNEEKRAMIVYNLRMIAAAGELCLIEYGTSSADMITISRAFPDEMKARTAAVDGEDYSKLVYSSDATLVVETKTLGTIKYPEK